MNGHAGIIVEVVEGMRLPRKIIGKNEKRRALGTFRRNLTLKNRREKRKWY